MKVDTIVVVPHVHWDREWYFTCQESQVLAARDFTEALDYLEAHPDYPSYILDGQMAVVDEYCDTVPGARERIERLVREGRLHVGPWYTQTDQMIVGAESIVRNLLYGRASSERLGGTMRVGYVPDSFGHSPQMPLILNEFDIERYVFWRGQSEFCGTESNQFVWESADGSSVTAFQMPKGYATGKYLQTSPDALRERFSPLFALMGELASVPVAILPNGHDQMPIQTDIEEALAALRAAFPDRTFVLGSLDDAIDLLEGSGTPLPRVRAEFLDGKRERVHRSIFSVRNDLTVRNARVESLLSRRVEPLCTLASTLGMPYPATLIEQAWKLLLENHAHDSMGGCCSDKVNAQIKARYEEAEERAGLLAHYYERTITEAAALPTFERLGLFNMDCGEEERLVTADVLTKADRFELVDADGDVVPYDVIEAHEVDPGTVDRQIVAAGNYEPFLSTRVQFRRRVPAVGYEVLSVRELPGERPVAPAASDVTSFETDACRVTLNANGTVDIATKGEGRHAYRGVLELVAEGNDGDEYDFSPVPGGAVVRSSEVARAKTSVVEHEHTVEALISYALPVPSSLEGWRAGAGAVGTVELGVEMRLVFNRASDLVDVSIDLDNKADDLRVRVLVPTGIASSVSLADTQFGQVERPVVDPGLAVWERDGWSERPDAIFPFLSYVALSGEGRTACVLTNGTREYEVVGEEFDTLAVTLLSCVGTLGRSDLVRRPGRPSGISVDTPDAQCHGTTSFSLALLLADHEAAELHLPRRAARWLTPVDAFNRFTYAPIQLNRPARELPARAGLLSQANPDLALSSIKRSESGDAVLARFYNATPTEQGLQISGATAVASRTMAEDAVDRPVDTVRPFGVATVELDVKAGA